MKKNFIYSVKEIVYLLNKSLELSGKSKWSITRKNFTNILYLQVKKNKLERALSPNTKYFLYDLNDIIFVLDLCKNKEKVKIWKDYLLKELYYQKIKSERVSDV
jgi:hypothetical protein